MSRAISYHQFHPLPRLCNMFMIKFLKFHYIIPKGDDLSGRKILGNKNIFTLIPWINTIFRQRWKPSFSTISKRKGNSFNLTISLSKSFFFCISHKSTKLLRWDAASSLGRLEKVIFHNKIQQSSIDFTILNIIKRSNRSTKEIIIIGIREVTQFGIILHHGNK